MVKDKQVRRLFEMLQTGKTLVSAAAITDMDVKTARKYKRLRMLPSEVAKPHTWRTRQDPFDSVWKKVSTMLILNSGLQGKTIFQYLQREYPGQFADGQLRTKVARVVKT